LTLAETARVTLPHGHRVSVGAFCVLWDLQHRGLIVAQDTTGMLLVSPGRKLTPEDERSIREHGRDLLALIKHQGLPDFH
jgi:hypothetical protein